MDQQTRTSQTAAEQAIVAAYADAVGRMHGSADTALMRDTAIEAIKRSGLPSRRIEAWHYTDLRTMLREFNPLALRPADGDALRASGVVENLVDAVRLPFFDGHYFTNLAGTLPEGVDARSFAATAEAGEDLAPWEFDIPETDMIGTLNAAFFRDGLDIRVADGEALELPVSITSVQAGESGAFAAIRNNVAVGAGARATFIEHHLTPASSNRQNCAVTRLEVGEGADVTWLIVQEGGEAATHFGQIRLSLQKNAKLTLFFINAGSRLVRQEIIAEAVGEGSDFQLRGVNLLAGQTHTDVTMVLDHKVPDTTSVEIIRNIVMGKAQGVFQGQIRVHKGAQKTDARMACNTLLLSDEGGFSTKPELEIFADDVQCGHGATVAEIDHSHLFYLMSRGIGEKDARRLLVKAFLREIIEHLEDEALVEALESKLELWFEQHG